MQKVTVFITFFVITFLNSPLFSNELNQPLSPYIKHTATYEKLFKELDGLLEESRMYGATMATDKQIKYVNKLVAALQIQILETANELGKPSLGQLIWQNIQTHVLPHLNYKKIFKYVIETSRKLGPKFAVAFALTEILDSSMYVLAAIQPKFAMLIPLSFFHFYDFVVYGTFFGVPEIMTKVKTYIRFGGMVSGMRKYYHHMVEQKKVLPIDWTEVINLEKINFKWANDNLRIDLVILKNSFLERLLPNKLQQVLFPRRLAQRQTSAAITITDLEHIAKQFDIPLYAYKGTRHVPSIYVKLLLREILSSSEGHAFLLSYLGDHSLDKYINKPVIENPMNILNAVTAASAQELSWIGENPDTLAQRMIWFYEDQIERTRELGTTTKIDYKLLREINKLVQKDLRKIAESPVNGSDDPENFEELYKLKSQISQKLEKFESKPKLCSLVLSQLNAK